MFFTDLIIVLYSMAIFTIEHFFFFGIDVLESQKMAQDGLYINNYKN